MEYKLTTDIMAFSMILIYRWHLLVYLRSFSSLLSPAVAAAVEDATPPETLEPPPVALCMGYIILLILTCQLYHDVIHPNF